jgi:hypothetical protein
VPEEDEEESDEVPEAPEVPDGLAVAFCASVVNVCCALAAVMTDATHGAPLKVQLLSVNPGSRTPVPLNPNLMMEFAAAPELQLGDEKV